MKTNNDQNKPDQNTEKGERGGKPSQQENPTQGKHERKNDPVAQKGSGTDEVKEQSQGQKSGERQRPDINEDEQRKITNESKIEEPMGEQEKEGD